MMIRKADMKEVYKTKSQVREETADAVEQFLRAGGSIQIVPAKKMRKRTTQKMSGKTTRQASTGTSGFARGYARSSFGA
jgi:predicted urease superfamily metal-dependent hydrolase